MQTVVGDKGYDADALVAQINAAGAKAVIPPRSNRREPRAYDRHVYKDRNLVERFFALITDKAIRRGSFRSVTQLITKIDHFVSRHNQNCKPFVWTATADSILAKLQRICQRISGARH